jgi:hypothetical protein
MRRWIPRASSLRFAAALVTLLTVLHAGDAIAQRGATFVERPLVTGPRRLLIRGGLGIGQCVYCFSQPGMGIHGELAYGLAQRLEVVAGIGVRFGYTAVLAGAERYARVNSEWLPSRDASGDGTFTNPYFKLRFAFVNNGPFMIGFEFYHDLPFDRGPRSAYWAVGFGLPIHIVLAHRVRLETGAFLEAIATPGAPFYWFEVPFRINFQVVDALWLGIRGGMQVENFRFDAFGMYFPLGFQGGVRVVPQMDLVFDLVFPEFIHTNDSRRGNEFFNAWGVGIGVMARIL